MERIINPGMIERRRVFVKITYNNGVLSLHGVIGPYTNGNAWGGCGQIRDELDRITRKAPGWTNDMIDKLHAVWKRWHLNDMRLNCEHQHGAEWEPKRITTYEFTMTAETVLARRDAERRAIDSIKLGQQFTPTGEETKLANLPMSFTHHCEALDDERAPYYRLSRTNIEWSNYIYPSVHPEGLLMKPCPVCGYEYGSSWRLEPVPADVIDWLFSLPETTVEPAWV